MTELPIELSRGSILKRQIALTFDGGGLAPTFVDQIIAALSSLPGRHSAFVTGQYIEARTPQVLKLLEAGFEIGNHTYQHFRLYNPLTSSIPSGITAEKLSEELDRTAKIFEARCGQKMAPLWRAPHGLRNATILKWASDKGYRHVYWTHDSGDWRTSPGDPQSKSGTEIISSLERQANLLPFGLSGAVLLFHLNACFRADPVFNHLESFARRLIARGYTFVSAGELLSSVDDTAIGGESPPQETLSVTKIHGIDLLGRVEGFYHDGWSSPWSALAVQASADLRGLSLALHVPDFFKRPVTLQVLYTFKGEEHRFEKILPPQGIHQVTIPLKLERTDIVRMCFRCPNPFNCATVGYSDDDRELAFILNEIRGCS
jgi:peptidoglycan/xylan/chitin deacetylase (PgdA/CDA1 family)